MNDFEGLLAPDYGFKPQGKSAPMAASNTSPANPLHRDLGSLGNSRSTKNSNSKSFTGSFPNDGDSVFVSTNSKKNQNSGGLDDFLGGSGKFNIKSDNPRGDSDFNFDSMFRNSGGTSAQSMNPPIYDQPVYDDDIFDGVPGLKSSSKVKYDDVFDSSSSQSKRNETFDDLLGGFGKTESESNTTSGRKIERDEKSVPSFDDLLPGFGGRSSPGDRTTSESKWSSESTAPKTKSKPMEDPFTVSGNFTDPTEEVNKLGSTGRDKINSNKAENTRIFEDVDPFAGLGKPVTAYKSDENNKKKDKSPSRADLSTSEFQSSSKKTTEKTSVSSPDRYKPIKSVEYDKRSDQVLFDMPTSSSDSQKFAPRHASPPSYAIAGSKDTNVQGNTSPMFADNLDESEEVWLTVSEIPLFTQPTSAPPPSRPPPPIPGQVPKSSSFTHSKGKANSDYYSFPNSTGHVQSSKPTTTSVKVSDVSPLDEFEDFAMGANRSNASEHGNGLSSEELEMNSAAAAMKEAMDRAEAKFRYAREVREREGTKTARSKESGQLDKDEKIVQDERARRQERIDRERLEREREREEEREKQRIDRERVRARVEKENEEKEREQKRLEKARELEIEREKARQAVERATREARERAAADARLKAERAAVGKANAEARERAERAAVQRAQAEARERAAAEARERAEKAATEARERKNMEVKEREAREKAASAKAEAETRARAERAAVERVAAEARERAAAASAASAAASASARKNQQQNENDFESFFSMGSRASSAPRHRDASSDNFFDPQPQRPYEPETAKTTSVPAANMRKASSATNIVDDLSSIFRAAPSSGDFQEVDGESEERRRARFERQQRTQERAAKALAEKNQRDLQIQREQAERHRISETLDAEIKRWAAGKEGNLRALLSTLQYVLWPECGWQPVSLTDLITGPAVKKVYRKATLCIHPDKVQQKGANLQQKYVAEKVFDILKEAWNKFNSEELF